MKYLLIIALLFSSLFSIAQNYADKEYYLVDSLDLDELSESDRGLIDSCLNIFHTSTEDTLKVMGIETIIANNYDDNVWPKYNDWLYRYILVFLKDNDLKDKEKQYLLRTLSLCLGNKGYLMRFKGRVDGALVLYKQSIKIAYLNKDTTNITLCLNNIAAIYDMQGKIELALKNYNESLKILLVNKNYLSLGYVYNNIARLYANQNNIAESIKYIDKAIYYKKKTGDKFILGNSYVSKAITLFRITNYKEGKIMLDSALINYESIQNKEGISYVYHTLGGHYLDIKDYKKALNYYNKSLEIRKLLGHKEDLAYTLLGKGDALYGVGSYDEAVGYALEAQSISNDIGFPTHISHSSKLLSQVYEKLGYNKKALKYYKLHIQMRDSINNEETQKAAIRQQTQYEFEKEQIRKENEAKEKARVEAEQLKRRDNLEYSLIFLGILLLFGLVLMLGFVQVSSNVAEGLIFFSFLILFEFILVFAEPYINEYTDGEPIYTLIANAAIALLIFPLHDVLESKLKKRIVKK